MAVHDSRSNGINARMSMSVERKEMSWCRLYRPHWSPPRKLIRQKQERLMPKDSHIFTGSAFGEGDTHDGHTMAIS